MARAMEPAIRLPEPWRQLDRAMAFVAAEVRLLPRLLLEGAVGERARLRRALAAGRPVAPRWRWVPRAPSAAAEEAMGRAERLVSELPEVVRGAYRARLCELRLEAAILHGLGRPAVVRPLARRRFVHGRHRVPGGSVPLSVVAERWLHSIPPVEPEPGVLAARGEGGAAELFARVIHAAGLDADVRVEPMLGARAAASERAVWLADRRFGRREALGLAVHEVLGHLVSAANARAQPVGLLRVGTAGSFDDQEGLALWLEQRAGLLEPGRRRMLAARVLAADWVLLDGADFVQVARRLFDEYGFSPEEAVALAERACRGGGVARDAGYLMGLLRVRAEVARRGERDASTWLRSGRTSVSAWPLFDALRESGLWRLPPYRPSLSRSLAATRLGTSLETSPPSAATSLTSPEAT